MPYEAPPPVAEPTPIAVVNRGADTPENRASAECSLRQAGAARITFEVDQRTKGMRCLGYVA